MEIHDAYSFSERDKGIHFSVVEYFVSFKVCCIWTSAAVL